MKNKNMFSIHLWILLIVCFFSQTYVYAVEQKQNQIQMLYVNNESIIYEDADNKSAEIGVLKKMEVVMPLKEEKEYYLIRYKDMQGYVEKENLQKESPQEEIKQEIMQMEKESIEINNEVLRIRREKAVSKIWGGIAITIIIAIFVTGIVNSRKQEEK